MKIYIYEIDLFLIIHFYSDISEFETNLTITQFRPIIQTDLNSQISTKEMEIPILYDIFIFGPFQRKYPIYKKKLYTIITFYKKYNYLYKHPYKFAIVHTN